MTSDIQKAIRSRRSIRAFLPTPVPRDLLADLLALSRWAPSGGNLQPWRIDVVTGPARDRLIALTQKAIANNPFADEAELQVYPKNLQEPFRTRRYDVGEAMYAELGIPRDDKMARLAHLARNYKFFDAPVGLFFSLDRQFDKGQWAHLGMLMQTIALAAHDMGLSTCMQEAWTQRAKTVTAFLGLPETQQLYCGMALGYSDPNAPVNKTQADRATIDEFVIFHDE